METLKFELVEESSSSKYWKTRTYAHLFRFSVFTRNDKYVSVFWGPEIEEALHNTYAEAVAWCEGMMREIRNDLLCGCNGVPYRSRPIWWEFSLAATRTRMAETNPKCEKVHTSHRRRRRQYHQPICWCKMKPGDPVIKCNSEGCQPENLLPITIDDLPPGATVIKPEGSITV